MSSLQSNSHDDDHVLPFRIEHLEVSGRLVRLGPAIDDILTRHTYPDRVSQVLGQALLLVAMFGSMIKDRQSTQPKQPGTKPTERFILQTQSDGAINLIVADYVHPGHLRGYARFNEDLINELTDDELDARLLGKGHLAMTIDRGSDTDRYQGIVSLEDEGPNIGLSGAANQYFQQSEQLPTYIRLAMAKHFDAMGENTNNESQDWHWRGGALMIQKLTSTGGHKTSDQVAHEQLLDANDDESWNRTHILSQSIKDHELLDPVLSSTDLLYRLYHQDGVRIFDVLNIGASCSCSLKGVENMLAGFTKSERKDMVKDDGKVHITCEFCNRTYEITPLL
ncbi:MAG: Hsp33 family molecular chaperone [bacterium]|nr:Hsp33 family molecular chaperone [bacterium]